MNALKTFTLALLLTALTAGCGGGGGGGSAIDDGVTLESLLIDQNNAMEVTAAVVDAVAIAQELGSVGVDHPVAAAAAATNDVNALPPTFFEFVYGQLDRFQLLRAPATDVHIAAIVIPPTTEACAVSGTMMISATVADETGTFLSSGDTMNISFSECNDGDGEVANGDMAIEVVAGVDFDFTPPYDFTFDIRLTNFSITEIASGESFTGNGNMTLREAVTADALFIETEVSGNKLTVTEPGESLALKDYWVGGTLDVALGDAYTADSSAR